jgi:hypothetical protein
MNKAMGFDKQLSRDKVSFLSALSKEMNDRENQKVARNIAV